MDSDRQGIMLFPFRLVEAYTEALHNSIVQWCPDLGAQEGHLENFWNPNDQVASHTYETKISGSGSHASAYLKMSREVRVQQSWGTTGPVGGGKWGSWINYRIHADWHILRKTYPASASSPVKSQKFLKGRDKSSHGQKGAALSKSRARTEAGESYRRGSRVRNLGWNGGRTDSVFTENNSQCLFPSFYG